MFKKIFDRHKLEVSIICCGDTGQDIGAEMIHALKRHGAEIKSLAITSELEQHHQSELFNYRISIDNTNDGFAKKFDDGLNAALLKTDEINDVLRKIVPSDDTGLMLLTTGAGATGLGSTLVVIDLLYRNFRKVPPIVTLLPETFETSRVQYNISVFLYRIVFRTGNHGNSVLLLDNKPNLDELDQPMSYVSTKRIETMPHALADLLYASFEKPISDEFDAGVADLYEVIHTPGIAAFVSEDLGQDESGQVDSSRIEDVISDSVISTTSLTKDDIFLAKNAFISMYNLDSTTEKLSFQSEFEARKLYQKFSETHPFVKIVSEEDSEDPIPKLRAIISGLPLPSRVLQIMRIARDTRKRILSKEKELGNEIIPLNIELIQDLETKIKS